MRTLTVYNSPYSDKGENEQYRDWLEKNLPPNIELNWQPGTGISRLCDEDGNVVENGANEWWTAYCEDA